MELYTIFNDFFRYNGPPLPGLEPGSPYCQSGALPTELQSETIFDLLCRIQSLYYKDLIDFDDHQNHSHQCNLNLSCDSSVCYPKNI